MKYLRLYESFDYDEETLRNEIEGILVDILDDEDILFEIYLSKIEYCNIIINFHYTRWGGGLNLSKMNEPIKRLYDYMKYKFGNGIRFMVTNSYDIKTRIHNYNIDDYFRGGFVKDLKLVFSEK